jgi:eukaryotic-like serine/threonine-protein kinase
MRARAATWLLAVAVLAGSAGAVAATPPWVEHYRKGLALEQGQRWQDAAGEFVAAIRGEKAPRRFGGPRGTGIDYDPYFHLAHCLFEAGRPREAAIALHVAYRAGVTPRGELDPLRTKIEERLRGPLPRRLWEAQSELDVESEPSGAGVAVDGVPVGLTPLKGFLVPPGDHRVRVEAPGYAVEEETVTFAPGPTTLRYGLRPLPSPVPAAAAPIAKEPKPRRRPSAAAPVVAIGPTASPTAAPTPPPAETPVAQPSPAPSTVAVTELPPRHGRLLWLLLMALAAAAAIAAVLLVRRRSSLPAGPTAATRQLAGPTVQSAGLAPIKGFQVLDTLGRGGMATTYRARRERDGAMVALKVPHEFCLSDATFVSRFVREGRLGEQLHHPRIVRILEAGESEGRPFLAMELLTGRTLKEELRSVGGASLRVTLERARDIAEALDYAHAKGVVHRDLKPENIMLLDDGTLKVMDFGIARLTGQEGLTTASLFIGTPQYAAPEMVEPTTIDHRVDLYALGIILFEMLEGSAPFTADSPYRVLEMHLHVPLPERSALAHPVPEPVWRIVVRLCAKNRDDRYPDAEALLVELNRLLHDFSELEREDGE